ncbi:MAG: hypothetical protein KKD01_10835 [Proteobacteria bacterium]|nr:hypothetical protein [Pseudomonadota bacterium]MBU1455210.1 hypothetical protein [Pseudomonadota bacterium]
MLIISVCFVSSFLSGISLAQNHVVVIPLISHSDNKIQTVTSANGRVWMDRNLGASRAAVSADDSLAYGWMFQWGRLDDGHQVPISSTDAVLSDGYVPGHTHFITTDSAPFDWMEQQNNNLWQGVSGINNPCPSGFRLPTKAEWEKERDSWITKNPAGAFASPLKLVEAGYRDYSDGKYYTGGYCWSSTIDGVGVYSIYFSDATITIDRRGYGQSVRCIKD